ncbi:MAG TPA: hypothetical protein VKA19_00180 [Alphaproteobacteria bacterium]|nr:hypothetical protein [Alphaproteobacteria bacterium]
MSASMCRSAFLGASLCLIVAPLTALAGDTPSSSGSGRYTEYVVRTPSSDQVSVDALQSQLMDLIQAQAPSLEALRAEDKTLRERQQPTLDRLNGEVHALLKSQRDTRDALASQLQALRGEQAAYLHLHPDASEADRAGMRAALQTLKDRQRPIREHMKDALLTLLDRQKAQRDALREQRLALREEQRPTRVRLLEARQDLENRIAEAEDAQNGAVASNDIANDDVTDAGRALAPLSSGVAGLEQFSAPALSKDLHRPRQGQIPVRLDMPALPNAVDAR